MATQTAPASTTTEPWSPCRRHLMDLVFAVAVTARRRAVWRMPLATWQRIMRDPELKSNWSEHRNGRTSRILFDIPVEINRDVHGVHLTLTLNCAPGRD